MTDTDEASVTPLVRRAAAWSWRLLVIFAAAVVVLEVLRRFGVVVVPVALALMLTAMLLPAVDFLDRYGAARGGAVAFVVVLGMCAVVGIMGFVVSQFVDGLPRLVDQVTHSIDTLRNWLINGPVQLSRDQINHTGDTVIKSINDHQALLTSGALSTAGIFIIGAVIAHLKSSKWLDGWQKYEERTALLGSGATPPPGEFQEAAPATAGATDAASAAGYVEEFDEELEAELEDYGDDEADQPRAAQQLLG